MMSRMSRNAAAVAVGIIGWAGVFATSGATNAMANSLPFDNMYPTENANWPCVDYAAHGNFCQTDNSTLTVWLQGTLSSADKTTIKGRLATQYSPTDLAVQYPASPSYSGSAETDIVYQQSTSGMSGSIIGFTWCDDAVSTIRCDQEYVRFRYHGIDAELACHETGHAVGLTHGQNAFPAVANNNSSLGCMETPDIGNRPSLGATNVGAINATY